MRADYEAVHQEATILSSSKQHKTEWHSQIDVWSFFCFSFVITARQGSIAHMIRSYF